MRARTGRFIVGIGTAGLLAACGGGSHPASGHTSGPTASTTASPAATGPAASRTTSASATAHAAGATTATAGAPTGSTPATPHGSGSGGVGAGGTAAAGGTTTASALLPKPGHYTYAVSGTAHTPLGTQDLAGTSQLTVDPAQGARQHSVDRDASGSNEQTVEVSSGSVYLLDLHIAQQGFDEDFRPAARALVVPASPRRGESWSWRMASTDGRYAMAATLTVTDTDVAATVGSRTLRTVVVSSHIVITGSGFDMTIDQRDQAARGTPVVTEHTVVNGTAYGAKFSSDSTRRLRSTTPT